MLPNHSCSKVPPGKTTKKEPSCLEARNSSNPEPIGGQEINSGARPVRVFIFLLCGLFGCYFFCCLGGGVFFFAVWAGAQAPPKQQKKKTPPPKQQKTKKKKATAPSELFFCCLGGGRVLFFAVWAGAFFFCCLGGGVFFFLLFGPGACFFLLFGRGTGVHSLTRLPGSSLSDPTTKETEQQKKNGFRARPQNLYASSRKTQVAL